MRKLILFNMITLDGFFEGPNREIDWHNVDEEFNTFATQQLNEADTLLFGRVTYQLMESYWPMEVSKMDSPVIAEKMNNLPKVVFSKTLDSVQWNNTTLIKENVVTAIVKLKQQSGKDLLLMGSADLANTFMQSNLIDEYRIIVNPIVLGKGNPLFKNLDRRIAMKLDHTKMFNSGNILLSYKQV